MKALFLDGNGDLSYVGKKTDSYQQPIGDLRAYPLLPVLSGDQGMTFHKGFVSCSCPRRVEDLIDHLGSSHRIPQERIRAAMEGRETTYREEHAGEQHQQRLFSLGIERITIE